MALKPVCMALVQAFGGAMALGVLALPVWAEDAVRTEARVEVTGSAIRRVEAEQVQSVQVMTRKEIERTGATTVGELLRSLPVVEFNEVFEQSGSSYGQIGTSTIAMRGQYDDSVVVLLNGHRLPLNGIAYAGGVGGAVDVNMLPLSAIERVEVLADGASAIYGADAVGGVVNFITRKNFKGFETRAGYGLSSRGDGGEYSAGVTAGFGDYNRDRFNVLMSVDHFKREPIYASRRDISSSADFRHLGGPDARSQLAPEGNILDDSGMPTGETVKPCPAASQSATGCRFDFNRSVGTISNGANRTQLMLAGTLKASDSLRVSSELLYSYSSTQTLLNPAGGAFQLPDLRWYYGRFMQGGSRQQDSETGAAHFSLGLDGQVGAYDWQVHYGYSESRLVLRQRNDYAYTSFNQAVFDGLIDPTSSSNDPAIVEALKVSPEWHGLYASHALDAKLTGSLFTLPGGPADFAIGLSWLSEKRVDNPDVLEKAGEVIGESAQYGVNARRNASALFAEFNLPVRTDLEVQAALRMDHYPSASKASSRFAVAYRPSKAVLLRASYAESFRMPGLNELYGGQDQGYTTIGGADPTQITPAQQQWCAQQGIQDCNVLAIAVTGANADLKPERGKTLSFGVVVEPTRGLSLGVDWWSVRKNNMIYRQTMDHALQNGDWYFQDGMYYVKQLNANYAHLDSTGLDFDFRWRLPVAGGAVVLRESLTRFVSQRMQQDTDLPWASVVGIYLAPRWRNTASLSYEQPTWDATLSVRSTGGFADSDQFQALPDDVRQVGAHEEVDLNLGASVGKAFRLSGGVKNLFDRMPPFSMQNVQNASYSQLGYAELYSARGRFFYCNLSYAFN